MNVDHVRAVRADCFDRGQRESEKAERRPATL
jgi:hypothetical protein